MTRKPEQSPSPDSEVVKESQRWVIENQGLGLTSQKDYLAPRISSEIMDCSMPMTFDHYSLCSFGCMYCFAYYFKSANPLNQGKTLQLTAIDADKKLQEMRGEATTKRGQLYYEHFYKRKFLLHWGGLADPFCGFENKNKVGLRFIEGLGEMNYPTLFSFKGGTIFQKDYQSVFERYAKQRNFAFQTSIITNSDDLASKVEIGVPSTTRRLEALRMLSDMGYWTILRLRPFIVGISDQELDTLLERALAAGIKAVSMEFFAIGARANLGMKKRYDWLAKMIGVKDLMKYFSTLSPSERGGYMRLNRLVKEPYVRKVYEFCAKNNLVCGISDPDFKELNSSGSCCGMPDHYAPNLLLENWTRSQLTYHLKEARKLYHTTGVCKELRFDEVYGNESYLDEKYFSQEHVDVIGQSIAIRNQLTQRLIIQQLWNSLRSPSNPRNYLHGKLMPIRTDEKGNLVYIYTPMEYEQRWKNEGVDLTR
jgi:DNA repair photolyase